MSPKRAFLVACLCTTLAQAARATTWIAPQSPLSPEEWLEYSLSGADAVGIGHVVGVQDTLVDFVAGSGIPARRVKLRVARWLKGNVIDRLITVGTSAVEADPIHDSLGNLFTIEGQTRPILFMLSQTDEGLVLCASADPAGGGMRLLRGNEVAATEHRVSRILARLSVDSLIARADLIVRGHFSASQRCSPSETLWCVAVAVDSVLAGRPESRELLIYASLLGDIPTGDALYLLTATHGGFYKLIGYQAGGQAIRNGRLALWRLPMRVLEERVARLRKAGAPKEAGKGR